MTRMRSLILVGIIFASLSALGQPLPPPPVDSPPPNPVPLTGAEFLIAAGAALGVKKYLDLRKKKSVSETEGDV